MIPKKFPLYYSFIAIAFICALFALCLFGFSNLNYNWDFSYLTEYVWDSENQKPGLLLLGLWGTLWVSGLSIIFGALLGSIVGFFLFSPEPISKAAARFYVEIFRNTPVLVQLYVVFFVIGNALNLSAPQCGVLTLSLFSSAYLAEILRGTLKNFEKGQIDAAKSLGMHPLQIAFYVIGPQALRRLLAPLVGEFVSLVKDSALVSVVGLVDLTKSAQMITSTTFRAFETWFFIAGIYFLLNFTLSTFGRYLEKRLAPENAL